MGSLSIPEDLELSPIAEGLDDFRHTFSSVQHPTRSTEFMDCLQEIGDDALKELILTLVLALQNLNAARTLPSQTGRGTLRSDLLRIASIVESDDFQVKRFFPLMKAVIDKDADKDIWTKASAAVVESTPPRAPPSLNQTPWTHATSSFVNSSEFRKHVDNILKDELGSAIYVGIPGFYEAFFGQVVDLKSVAEAVFDRCREGDRPLFDSRRGWCDWPPEAQKISTFLCLADKAGFHPKTQRGVIVQPDQPLQGSAADRKLDIGFVNKASVRKGARWHWSDVLIPGELKKSPDLDKPSRTWRDLGRYAREVLTCQDTRRFVLGFTLCGSIMRLWEFDRLGGIASTPFDINKDGLRFLSVIFGFLWMDEDHLGLDRVVAESDGKRYLEIIKDGQKQRLVLEELIKRSSCVAGRATTCWKAYRDGDESKSPLVIKESWQYPERLEEGSLFQEAMKAEVINVARYYHHETVFVDGKEDDVGGNIRKNLDISKATNYRGIELMPPPSTPRIWSSAQSGMASSLSRKRSSSCTDAPEPPSKRTCSPTKEPRMKAPNNRVRRRVIVCDYGKPLYRARSRAAMLVGLSASIEGHKSLLERAGIIQSDISIGNLMVNVDENSSPWRGFLIDLDLSVKEQRNESSGARGKTGTRAFMAIGVLYGEKHSFMHDLESFFWVLFWICIHYNGASEKGRIMPRYDKWNYVDTEELAELKKGRVTNERDFIRTMEGDFTPYYQSLVPWVNKLRKIVFPNGGRWEREDRQLYTRMRDVLSEAQKDPQVLKE